MIQDFYGVHLASFQLQVYLIFTKSELNEEVKEHIVMLREDIR